MSSKEKNQAPGAEVRPLAALKVWKVAQRTRYTMVTALLLDLVGWGASHELGAYKGVHLRFVHVTARVP